MSEDESSGDESEISNDAKEERERPDIKTAEALNRAEPVSTDDEKESFSNENNE
jgi:hypothetical protein